MENLQKVQLISESTPMGSFDILVEQQNPKDSPSLKIKGPFLVTERRNGNGRLYKRDIVASAVRDYYRDYISVGRALGELGHPDRFEPIFEEACIKIDVIEESQEDPNVFDGIATVLKSDDAKGIKGTRAGDSLACMLQYGVKPGVSARALGQMSKDKVIDSIYKICAIDVVYTPSGPNCYVDGILESKQFLINQHGEVFESAYEKMEKNISTLPKNIDAKLEKLNKAFQTFMNEIK